jgi:hypothetical protein
MLEASKPSGDFFPQSLVFSVFCFIFRYDGESIHTLSVLGVVFSLHDIHYD